MWMMSLSSQALPTKRRSLWGSYSCRRATGWRSWRDAGGRGGSVPKRRTTGPKVSVTAEPRHWADTWENHIHLYIQTLPESQSKCCILHVGQNVLSLLYLLTPEGVITETGYMCPLISLKTTSGCFSSIEAFASKCSVVVIVRDCGWGEDGSKPWVGQSLSKKTSLKVQRRITQPLASWHLSLVQSLTMFKIRYDINYLKDIQIIRL